LPAGVPLPTLEPDILPIFIAMHSDPTKSHNHRLTETKATLCLCLSVKTPDCRSGAKSRGLTPFAVKALQFCNRRARASGLVTERCAGDCRREHRPHASIRTRRSPVVRHIHFDGVCRMTARVRHCVECPSCRTRYLVGLSPYPNGSYLLSTTVGSWDEYTLYCSCRRPAATSRWKWNEMKPREVSTAAYHRGYGTHEEIS
jgi:hypothetical protein